MGGRKADGEIPLLESSLYLSLGTGTATTGETRKPVSGGKAAGNRARPCAAGEVSPILTVNRGHPLR